MNTPNPAIAANTPAFIPPPSIILRSSFVNALIFKLPPYSLICLGISIL